MLFQEGGLWYLCTGSLISSSGHFLTNNHCISDQSGASSLEVWWRYQSSTCNGTTGSKEYTSVGSTFLTTNENLDFTLLQISDTNIEKYGFISIANRDAVKGERIWIPQHGGGNIKTFAVVIRYGSGRFMQLLMNQALMVMLRIPISVITQTQREVLLVRPSLILTTR